MVLGDMSWVMAVLSLEPALPRIVKESMAYRVILAIAAIYKAC